MKLSIIERIGVLGILPRQGNITILKVVAELNDRVGFTEEEHALLEFIDIPKENNQVETRWNLEGAKEIGEREFEFGPKGTELVSQALIELSDNDTLSMNHLSLYRKFVDKDLKEIPKRKVEPEVVK